jgi:hypothetical protein
MSTEISPELSDLQAVSRSHCYNRTTGASTRRETGEYQLVTSEERIPAGIRAAPLFYIFVVREKVAITLKTG